MNPQDLPKPATPLPESWMHLIGKKWEAFEDMIFLEEPSTPNCKLVNLSGSRTEEQATALAAKLAELHNAALHEKQAALALADALRMELRASRERCGKLEAALSGVVSGSFYGVSSGYWHLTHDAHEEARAALNAQPAGGSK